MKLSDGGLLWPQTDRTETKGAISRLIKQETPTAYLTRPGFFHLVNVASKIEIFALVPPDPLRKTCRLVHSPNLEQFKEGVPSSPKKANGKRKLMKSLVASIIRATLVGN